MRYQTQLGILYRNFMNIHQEGYWKRRFSNMIRFRRAATDAYLEVSSSVTKGDLTQVMLTKKIVTELFSDAGSVSL